MALDILPAYLLKKKFGGFNQSLANWIRLDKEAPSPGIIGSLQTPEAKRYFFMGMLLFLVFILSFCAGIGEARNKAVFPVDQNGWVLLRRYGDSLFLSEQSSQKNILKPLFHKVLVSADNGPWTLTRLGPFLATTPIDAVTYSAPEITLTQPSQQSPITAEASSNHFEKFDMPANKPKTN